MNLLQGVEVVVVRAGDARYDGLVGQLRDPVLAEQMWTDAEHELAEQPGKIWAFVTYHGEVAAWASMWPDGDLLRCGDNYERRGAGRDLWLYPLAYGARDRLLDHVPVPAVTYLFEQPLARHEADGWRRTGLTGVSTDAGEPHEWWELRLPPRKQQTPQACAS